MILSGNLTAHCRPPREVTQEVRAGRKKNAFVSETQLKATGDLIHPPSPGFRVTLISRCFIGKENSVASSTPCVWISGWFVP